MCSFRDLSSIFETDEKVRTHYNGKRLTEKSTIKNFYSNGLTIIPFKNVLAVEGDIMSCLDKDKLRMNTAVIWIKEVKEHLFLSGEECDDFLKEYQIYLNSK